MVLDGLDELGILGQHEVDGSTLSTVTTSSTDSVDVVFLLEGQLVVDNETNLLHINTSGKQVSGDEYTDGAGTELLHDNVSAELVHLTVHDRDSEVILGHGLLKFLNTFLGVTVDQGLVDIQVGVQVDKNVHLPLLLFDGDVVLVDTFEGKLLILDQNLRGVSHEMLGHAKNLWGKGSGEKSDLDVAGQELEDVLNLGLETTGQHLIGFVEHEKLEVLSLEESSLHHVVDTAGGADDDVGATGLELLNVIFDNSATDTSLNLDVHVLTDGVDDVSDLHGQLTGGGHDESLAVVGNAALGVSVNALQNTDGESTSLTGTRLSLGDGVLALDDGEDTFGLNGRWVLKTVTIDTAKDLLI